jgi:hypothetical protein
VPAPIHATKTATMTAISVSTSLGSLISIGCSVGDAVTLYSLGKNFLTASTDDEQLLYLLNLDEMDILKRKSPFDIAEFNKRWREQLNILVNGKAERIQGDFASSIQGEIMRFTAGMICIVAALDQFGTSTGVLLIMKELLKRLVRTTEAGEAAIDAQIHDRVRTWRSATVARGLADACKQHHVSLVANGIVQPGTFPNWEANEIADFL